MMPVEDEINDACKRLIDSNDGDEVRILAQQLRQLLHESTEEARSQIRVLPLLRKHAKRKSAV